MTDLALPRRASGVGRVGTAAAWVSGISCLPYLVLKVLWTVGIPLGISEESALDDTGWILANALMAVVQLVALALVVALVRPWSRRLPAWLLLFPAWVGTGLLFQLSAGAALSGLFSDTSQDPGANADPIQPWVYVLVYSAFGVQGIALAVAFATHVRARWGPLFSIASGEVVVGDNLRRPSWPERHLIRIAATVAWLALGMAIVFAFWSGGGAFALAGPESERLESMQVARVIGATFAALGLFGLAGRWRSQIPFWLTAALVWIGSGALVAFDGLALLFNGLFVLAGAESMSNASWELTDTVLLIKVLIGLLVTAVGVLAVRSAAAVNDDEDRTSRAAV